MRHGRRAAAGAILALAALAAHADPPPPPPPPMGVTTLHQGCAVSEASLRDDADAMVATGLAAAGYRLLVAAPCWQARSRDLEGRLVADPTRFPSGIDILAAQLRARGIRLALTTGPDPRPGDAAQFAAWGVAAVTPGPVPPDGFAAMLAAAAHGGFGPLMTGGAMTAAEQRCQLALYATRAAPLMIGTDVARTTPATLALLTDTALIAIDQDRQAGATRHTEGAIEVWARPLVGGEAAVLLLNSAPSQALATLAWSDLSLPPRETITPVSPPGAARLAPGGTSAALPGHACLLVRVTP